MEEWRVIADFPAYAVSCDGRIKRVVPDNRHGKVGHVLKQYVKRYANVTLYRDGNPHLVLVHRVACKAFHGAPPSPKHQVAHNDGNALNNAQHNLRWATSKENEADKIKHGTNLSGRPSWIPLHRRPRAATHGRNTRPDRTARGEKSGSAKLTDEQVYEIRLSKQPRKELSARYGVSVTMIGYIQRGISWAHIPMPQTGGRK